MYTSIIWSGSKAIIIGPNGAVFRFYTFLIYFILGQFSGLTIYTAAVIRCYNFYTGAVFRSHNF